MRATVPKPVLKWVRSDVMYVTECGGFQIFWSGVERAYRAYDMRDQDTLDKSPFGDLADTKDWCEARVRGE